MDIAIAGHKRYLACRERDDDAVRNDRRPAGLHRLGLTPHLMRDLGLVDAAVGSDPGEGLAALIGSLPPRL